VKDLCGLLERFEKAQMALASAVESLNTGSAALLGRASSDRALAIGCVSEFRKVAKLAGGTGQFASIFPCSGLQPNHIPGSPGVAAPDFPNNCMIAAVHSNSRADEQFAPHRDLHTSGRSVHESAGVRGNISV
jgi:hypothetical protein